MKKALVFLVTGLLTGSAWSQEAIVPHGMSPAEEQLMNSGLYQYPRSERGITTPPSFPVRTMAEWEEIQTLVITWTSYPSILAQIVDAAQEECEVLIACSDSNAVKTYLTGTAGVPLTNVNFLEVPFNSIWIRDYGSHTVYENMVDSLCLVDWIYNRPRPFDDAMPVAHANLKNITLFQTTVAPNNLMNTGGNWMVDGFGTAFASELILDENDGAGAYALTYPNHTEPQIDQIMGDFMGISRYIKMPTLPYDGIHHIDMHMKLIDEETLLVGEYPAGVADGPQIEANLQYVLSTFNSVYGTPYKVIRIPQPPSTGGLYPNNGGSYRTYANNVFVNKTLIVPYYRQEWDTVAERILGDALPGYNIVGIDVDNSGANLISQSGAIHCITNAIGVNDPLLIRHQNLADTYDTVTAYTVNALITHKTGITNATLHWSLTAGTGYTAVPMTYTGSGDIWTAQIPAQSPNTVIYYYIHASANNSKQQTRPIVAPSGYFHFQVLDLPNGINEIESNVINKIYPNPANAITCIELNIPVSKDIKVYMLDMLGRNVNNIFEGIAQGMPARYFVQADKFSSGTYFVVLETPQGKSVQKLIIK